MICPRCRKRHGYAVELVPASKRGSLKCPVGGERYVRAGGRLRLVSP